MPVCTLTKQQKTKLRELIDAAQQACADLNEFASDIAGDWENEIDEKSDKWKEGEAGTEAQDRLTDFQAWVDELPGDDIISNAPGMD